MPPKWVAQGVQKALKKIAKIEAKGETPPGSARGIKMNPKWTQNDAQMDAKWSQNGSKMELRAIKSRRMGDALINWVVVGVWGVQVPANPRECEQILGNPTEMRAQES